MKNVCLLIYTVAAQFSSVRGICLHWNATNDNVFLKCQVFSYVSIESEIQLMDSNDQIRVKCSFNESSYCVAKEEGDIVFGEASTNGFRLVLQTTKKDVKGDWKCFHGSEKAIIHIDISKGIVYPADIHLSGEIRSHSKITLTCYSCWIPDTESVYFFVNNVLEDVVRLHEGKCYRKRKACSQKECTCSTEGNYFTWSFTSDLPDLEFSCEMRFKDEKTSQLSIHTANLYYNETEFQQKMKTIRNIPVSDKDIYINGGTDKENLIYLGIVTLISTVSANLIIIGIAFGCIVLRKITAPEHVLFKEKCSVCQQLSVCAICIDCKQGFCDPCCEKHLKFEENLSHIVFQIQHVATSQEGIKCGITKCKTLAEQVCINCWVQRCASCVSTDHDVKCIKQEMILIYQKPSSVSPKQHTGDEQDKLQHLRTIPIQGDKYPVRIYGIDYLEDGTLVAIDKNNKKIIVFTADFKHIYKKLENEPSSMTAMTGNEIAVTFPCIKHIKVYTIDLNSTEGTATFIPTKVIRMRDLGIRILKPFSIAFNKDFFAVEVGEGEDGKIILFENSSNKKYNIASTIQCKFAYFTGHSIRFALAIDRKDMNNKPRGRLYLSTMSNKMVSCIDLEGTESWKVSMPSPRSIIIVPKKHSFGNSIILSSRRFNAIYVLDKENGKDKILQASEINSPRYIACHFEKNTFCILVKNKKLEDELAIFEFKNVKKQDDRVKNSESNELTSLVEQC